MALSKRKTKKGASDIVVAELNLNFPKPSAWDIVVFQMPLAIVRLALRPFGKKTVVDNDEDQEPVVVSRTPNKKPVSKRKLKKQKEYEFDANFIE